MWWQLDEKILEESKRLIRQHETYAKSIHDENTRRKRRSSGDPELLPVRRPGVWRFAPGFDPYIVRSRHARVAHALTRRLKDKTYAPMPPAGFEVPKAAGKSRTVSTFQIVDEVISRHVFQSLMQKNLARLSGRAYAYRADRGTHDAVSYISREFKRHHRLFVAEYDFTQFFEKVNHEFLLETLDTLEISRTELEQHIIEKFITTPYPYLHPNNKGEQAPARERGFPQGTSLSLFLANVAASELDRALERLGVGFVRYADDTLIWSNDYGRINEAAAALYEAADRIGSPINFEKSPGIRLLQNHSSNRMEIVSTSNVDFLGHSLGLRKILMKDSSGTKIRKRINQLIYDNLLREPLQETQNLERVTGVDKDYITLIWQLRRYLYGPLSEKEVRRYQQGALPPLSFKGVMSFFPLLEDDDNLKELDSWIATQVWLALQKRTRLLRNNVSQLPDPHYFTKRDLIGFQTWSQRTNAPIDLRMPSVRKIATAIKRAVSTHGFGVVTQNAPLYHYDDEITLSS